MKQDGQAVQYAYVDESGDPHLDLTKHGTSRFYVVTALLVDDAYKDALVADVDDIRSHFFGKGEMKSSNVGSNIARRKEIISALMQANVRFYAFVADKSQIDTNSGLQYKKSFIKYLHGRLYKRLYSVFTSLHVLADEHGHSEFMESFQRYLQDRYQKELFDHADFAFIRSEAHPLVQAADIVGGSLLRVYSERDPVDLRNLLSKGAIIIERWPPSTQHADLIAGLSAQEQFDHLVSQQSIMLAREFIRTYADTDDPDTCSQVEALRYLLYRYELDPTFYIHAQPILDHVNSCRNEDMTLQSFRMNVIGKLRSHGVIIASSNKGYKIPNTNADISDFVALVDGQALPYLSRLAQARQHLLLASQGEYDIVNQEQYPQLHNCLIAMGKGQFEQTHAEAASETASSAVSEAADLRYPRTTKEENII